MTAPSLDRVRDAFEQVAGPGKQSGQWTLFCCPCHDDHHASAAITHNISAGRTVVKCFAGCDSRDILEAIGVQVRDLYDEPRQHPRGPQSPREAAARRVAAEQARREALVRRERTQQEMAARRAALAAERGPQTGPTRLVRSYIYEQADGTPAGSVCRYVTPHEHKDVKDFRQFQWDTKRRKYIAHGFDPVLYHLPEVRQAVDEGRTIVLVEGEKDADRGRAEGFVATCNAMGADTFTADHAAQLAGAARVVIVADRDQAGYRHAAHVRDLISGTVGAVYTVRAVEGKDLSDHLDAGHPISALVPCDPLAELHALTNPDSSEKRPADAAHKLIAATTTHPTPPRCVAPSAAATAPMGAAAPRLEQGAAAQVGISR